MDPQRPHGRQFNPTDRSVDPTGKYVEGNVYRSLPEKHVDVHAFLQEPEAGPACVRSLAG